MYSDAFKKGLGCMLMQNDNVIGYASCQLKPSEQKLFYTGLGVCSSHVRFEDLEALLVWQEVRDRHGLIVQI